MIQGRIDVGDKLVWQIGTKFAMGMEVIAVRPEYRGVEGCVWLTDESGREYRDTEERVRHLCERVPVLDVISPAAQTAMKNALDEAYNDTNKKLRMYTCLTCKDTGRVEAPNAQFTTHCPSCNPENNRVKIEFDTEREAKDFMALARSLNAYEVTIATGYLKLLVKTRPQNASAKFTMGKI